MEPYSISCLTCRSRLTVSDASLIGQILMCPKCESMVQVIPPESVEEVAGAEKEAKAAAVAIAPPPIPESESPPVAAESPPVPSASDAAASVPPPLDFAEVLPGTKAEPVTNPGIPAMPVAPEPTWRKWLVTAASGALGVIFATGVWMYWSKAGSSEPESVRPVANADAQDPEPPELQLPAESPLSNDYEPAPAIPENSPEERPQNDPSEPRKKQQPPPTSEPVDETKPDTDPSTTKPDDADPLLLPDKTPKTPSSDEPGDEEVQPTDVPLPKVSAEVDQRLSIQIDGVAFNKTPFRDVIAVLSQIADVPVRYDAAILAEVGMTADTSISVNIERATLSEILQATLVRRGLTHVAAGDQILVAVSAPQEGPLRRIRYRVADLATDRDEIARLADIVQKIVEPAAWKPNGGRGQVDAAEGALVVEQTMPVQFASVLLLEKLRIARGLPPRSRLDPALFELMTRSRRGEKLLSKRVTLDTGGNAPLGRSLLQLSTRCQATIAVDELGLLRAGLSSDSAARLAVVEMPLADALRTLLKPLGLAFRVVDRDLLQITTVSRLRRFWDVELYRVDWLAEDEQAPVQLIRRIEREIAPHRWADAGGQGAVVFDAASRCLIVRQTQPVQKQVESALTRWAAE